MPSSKGFVCTRQTAKRNLIRTNSIVLPGVNIDDHVTAGAGDVVTGDVISNSLVVGNPAQVVG